MNSFRQIVQKNRSYRRFDESKPISERTLRDLVELTRFCASGTNIQALKFALSWKREENERIFGNLHWAGYLTDWPGPEAGERPTGYVVILGDLEIRKNFGIDPGIVAQTILLGAAEQGLGGCMIGAIDRDGLRSTLRIPERFEIVLVIALGTPVETVVVEDLAPGGSIKYYRDAERVHHVPKRTLDELIVSFDG
jgi:nitroreductase